MTRGQEGETEGGQNRETTFHISIITKGGDTRAAVRDTSSLRPRF